MTPKIIELKQAPVILVELPEGAEYEVVSEHEVIIGDRVLSKKDYEGVNILSDLTEEQFAECVAKPHFIQFFSAKIGPFYTDYSNQGRSMMSAKYSWDTLIDSEQVYTENPYSKPLRFDKWYKWGEFSDLSGSEKIDSEKYWAAQSRTIDPNRTVVLIRKEEK